MRTCASSATCYGGLEWLLGHAIPTTRHEARRQHGCSLDHRRRAAHRSTTAPSRSGTSSRRRRCANQTDGGFLELINEFEVAAGSAVHPHAHPTHEWYYVTAGRGRHDGRRRGSRRRPGRSRLHPAERRAQPAAADRQRSDPLLLLRLRRARASARSTTRRTERSSRAAETPARTYEVQLASVSGFAIDTSRMSPARAARAAP